jgi:hypothetical protein
MKDCEMKQEDCIKKSGCKGMEGKSIYKEVIITNEDTLPKKQIIIRKK